MTKHAVQLAVHECLHQNWHPWSWPSRSGHAIKWLTVSCMAGFRQKEICARHMSKLFIFSMNSDRITQFKKWNKNSDRITERNPRTTGRSALPCPATVSFAESRCGPTRSRRTWKYCSAETVWGRELLCSFLLINRRPATKICVYALASCLFLHTFW